MAFSFGAPTATAAPTFGAPAPAAGGFSFGAATAAPAGGGFFGGAAAGQKPATGLFGAPAAAPTAFGQTTTSPFGATQQKSSPFGAAPTAFGQTGGAFGAAAQAQPGTGQPPYQPHRDQEQNTSGKRMEMVYHCITTNPAYRAKSFEELRLEDYKQGNQGRGGPAPAAHSTAELPRRSTSARSSASHPANAAPAPFAVEGGGSNSTKPPPVSTQRILRTSPSPTRGERPTAAYASRAALLRSSAPGRS